jgi:hypothetical protein
MTEPSPIDWTDFDTALRLWITRRGPAPHGVVSEEIGPFTLPPVDIRTLDTHCRQVHGLSIRQIRVSPVYLEAWHDLYAWWHGSITLEDKASLEAMYSVFLTVSRVPPLESAD